MRLLNRIYAFLFGYFWLPCPLCGEMFGGHEAGLHSVPIRDRPGVRRICCKKHDYEAFMEAIVNRS